MKGFVTQEEIAQFPIHKRNRSLIEKNAFKYPISKCNSVCLV